MTSLQRPTNDFWDSDRATVQQARFTWDEYYVAEHCRPIIENECYITTFAFLVNCALLLNIPEIEVQYDTGAADGLDQAEE